MVPSRTGNWAQNKVLPVKGWHFYCLSSRAVYAELLWCFRRRKTDKKQQQQRTHRKQYGSDYFKSPKCFHLEFHIETQINALVTMLQKGNHSPHAHRMWLKSIVWYYALSKFSSYWTRIGRSSNIKKLFWVENFIHLCKAWKPKAQKQTV